MQPYLALPSLQAWLLQLPAILAHTQHVLMFVLRACLPRLQEPSTQYLYAECFDRDYLNAKVGEHAKCAAKLLSQVDCLPGLCNALQGSGGDTPDKQPDQEIDRGPNQPAGLGVCGMMPPACSPPNLPTAPPRAPRLTCPLHLLPIDHRSSCG